MSLMPPMLRRVRASLAIALGLHVALVGLSPAAAQTSAAATRSSGDDVAPSGPIRLRSTATAVPAPAQAGTQPQRGYDLAAIREAPEYVPGEFERFVQKLVDQTRATSGDRAMRAMPQRIRRFGAELMIPPERDGVSELAPIVPPDYLIKAGDELIVTLWGSVDADVRVVVDRTGRITIPRVGPVLVAGVRYADVTETISRRVAQVFRNFQLSVTLGQLRGLRIYVTGYVMRPGAYSAESLSTLLGVLAKAGGPSAAGSFRNVQLKRGGQSIATFDLYDFLLSGDRGGDRLLEAGDVIHVGAVGPQVGVIGSVNQPAVLELKAGETIADALRMAGGLTAVADRSRIAIERLDDRSDRRIRQVELPADEKMALVHGDVVRAFSTVDVTLPNQRQNKRIRVEGEVARPGEYVLPPDSTINDALRSAGGLTASAFVFGTEFTRESVRITQNEQYDRALRDLETEFSKTSATQRVSNAEEAAAQRAQAAATTQLVERLRAVRPTGRIVLQISPDSTTLPELALEDGDRLYVPPRPSTVGVFGSVFNAGSYLFSTGRQAEHYLLLAGGPTRGADESSVFVIRANGSVISGRQRSQGWLSRGNGLGGLGAEPGDTIFVPEEMNKTTVVQSFKDWTQVLYQFGLGLAGVKALGL